MCLGLLTYFISSASFSSCGIVSAFIEILTETLVSANSMPFEYGELALDPAGGTVFISHGDCLDDAQKLAAMLHERFAVKVAKIVYVGPVIGAHSGPGTIALFFLGRER